MSNLRESLSYYGEKCFATEVLVQAGSILACLFTNPGYCISLNQTKSGMLPSLISLSLCCSWKGWSGVRYHFETSSLLLQLDRVTGYLTLFLYVQKS